MQPSYLLVTPIVLFAVLHASSYSIKLLDVIGQNSWWGARFLISLVAVILAFMGRAGLMTPIVYYHFLVMRYSSRRNPCTRNAFAELHMATEALEQCSPLIVTKILYGGINFVHRTAAQPHRTPAAASGSSQ